MTMYKNTFLAFLIPFSFFYSVSAQQTLFNRIYDYMGHWQHLNSVIEVDDGYLTAMYTSGGNLPNLKGIIFMKTNKEGDTLWTKPYLTDSTSIFTYPPHIIASDDGHFLIAGLEVTPQEEDDIFEGFLIKFDKDGQILWQKRYEGAGQVIFRDFKQTPDGGYILGGTSTAIDPMGDFYLVKTDMNGEVEWESYLGGEGFQAGYAVDYLPDGGYVISGRGGNPPFATDIAVAKCNAQGHQSWSNIYGGPYGNTSTSVKTLSDGNILISGSMGNGSTDWDDDRDAYLIKVNPGGGVIWEKVYGSPFTNLHRSNILEVSNGHIVVAGIKKFNDGGPHQSTLNKFDANGEIIWQRIYPSPNPEADTYIYGIRKASDGGFLAYGTAYDPDYDNLQEGWFIKTDSQGYTCEEVNCVVTHIQENAPFEKGISLFPNPSSGTLNIKLTGMNDALIYIYASNGVLVWSSTIRSNAKTIDLNDKPSGLYYVKVVSDDLQFQEKVVLNSNSF